MTARIIEQFADPKMEIIYFALVHMLSVEQLCAACVALAERDKRECAEREAMKRKCGLL
jgi:hypothetical protein